MDFVLIYVGDASGGAYVPGVPARNLTEVDIAASGYALDELLRFRPAVWVHVNGYQPPALPDAPDADKGEASETSETSEVSNGQ